MTKSQLAQTPALTIEIHQISGYDDDYFRGYVYEGEELVGEVDSNYRFVALRRAKRAARLYKKHGIKLFS